MRFEKLEKFEKDAFRLLSGTLLLCNKGSSARVAHPNLTIFFVVLCAANMKLKVSPYNFAFISM